MAADFITQTDNPNAVRTDESTLLFCNKGSTYIEDTSLLSIAMEICRDLDLTAATAQTRPSKVCLWQVWEVPSGGD